MADRDHETPLLLETVDGAVDFQGRPILRSSSGGWKVDAFIISKCYESENPKDNSHNDRQGRVHRCIHVGDTHSDS
jgi:hypothetical protein